MTESEDTHIEQSDGRVRVIISGVKPEVDSGLFPAKAVVGEKVEVEVDISADGHDAITAILLYYRKEGEPKWAEAPMEFITNDRWKGSFLVTELGHYRYTVTAWVDRFKSWRKDFQKRVDAGQEDININLLVGANLIAEASGQASKADSQTMQEWMKTLKSPQVSQSEKVELALSEEVARVMQKYSDRRFSVTYSREIAVSVDRTRAQFSTWYEMFPRSCANEPGKHGTFKDCEARLPYIAEMGFDVLYFPPIHPIGRTLRKGRNNATQTAPDDPGTPWAIGAEEGADTKRSIHNLALWRTSAIWLRKPRTTASKLP
jgi:starch synthase (maltosyl-transferring)